MINRSRILIVDDNIGICRLLQEVFSDRGYYVDIATLFDEAYEKILANPSIVILDVKMPGINGLQGLKIIKSINTEIPVILMSAYSDLQLVKNKDIMSLAECIIEKPFDIFNVVNIVEDILSNNIKQKVM